MKRLTAWAAILAAAALAAFAQDEGRPNFDWKDYVPQDYSKEPAYAEVYNPLTGGYESAWFDPETGTLVDDDGTPYTSGDAWFDAALEAMGRAASVEAQLSELTRAYTNAMNQIDKVIEDLDTHKQDKVNLDNSTGTGSAHPVSGGCQLGAPNASGLQYAKVPNLSWSGTELSGGSVDADTCGTGFQTTANSLSAINQAIGWILGHLDGDFTCVTGISVADGTATVLRQTLNFEKGLLKSSKSEESTTFSVKACSDDCDGGGGEGCTCEGCGGGGCTCAAEGKQCECEIKTTAQVQELINARVDPLETRVTKCENDIKALDDRVSTLEAWKVEVAGYIDQFKQFLEKLGFDPGQQDGGAPSVPPRGK